MNRRAFVSAAAALCAAPARALAVESGGSNAALVTADLESHVVAVELGSGRVVARLRTAPGPRSIESSPLGFAVVAHTAVGVVTLLDVATLSVRAVLAGFGEPRYTAIHPTERLAYVTDSGRGDVATIDLVRGAVVHRTPVPGPARHLSLAGDGRSLWTALGTKAEQLAVLELAKPRAPRLRDVFAAPFLAHDVVVAPDGGHVWVTSGSDAALAVYSRAGGVPRLLRADAPPQHVAFAGGRAFVASGAEGTIERRERSGDRGRRTRVPRGSYNLSYATLGGRGRALVTPSLDRGTLSELAPSGVVRSVRRVARSAHDACLVRTG